MGDRNTNLGSGTLYFGDVKIGEVVSSEIKYDNDFVDESEAHIRAVFKNCFDEATFTAEVNFTSVLRNFCPNNWLKMHGYPMKRRRFTK